MNDAETLQGRVRVLRIIVGAMILGLALFAVIAGLVGPPGGRRPGAELRQILLLVLVLLAASEVPAYLLIRRNLVKNLRTAYDQAAEQEKLVEQLAPHFAMLTIIGCAMAEGIGFFGLLVVFVTGAWFGWAAFLVALLLLIAQFPRMARISGFVSSVTERWTY